MVLGDVNIMSQAYQIRRGGQIYLAPDHASLLAWIHQGRVRLDDEVRLDDSSDTLWLYFKDVPQLKALFPYAECHLIKRGNQTFKAHELSLIYEWARAGKIALDDKVYLPQEQRWYLAKDLSELKREIEAYQQALKTEKNPENHLSDVDQIQQLIAPAYDLARLYLVYQATPPTTALPAPAYLKSMHLDISGQTGKLLFEKVLRELIAHQQGLLTPYCQQISQLSMINQALIAFEDSMTQLTQTLTLHLDAFGERLPKRFIVGSEPEQQRHPAEKKALDALQNQLHHVIPCALRIKNLIHEHLSSFKD